MRQILSAIFGLLVVMCGGLVSTAAELSADYHTHAAPLFRKHCIACHTKDEANAALSLDDFASLMKGSENGTVVVPGKPDGSKLLRVLEGKAEPAMPPEGVEPPSPAEIAKLRAWIAAGAQGPKAGVPATMPLVTPQIAPTAPVRTAITAAAWSPDGKWIAVVGYGRVEILSGGDRKPVRVLDGIMGNVNDLAVSADSSLLAVGAGEPGLAGEATLWSTADWRRRQTIKGHGDALYAVALSPDGTILATGSYDQSISLWDSVSGEFLRELPGHNGPIFDLAFHPGGTLLASASGDRTIKLWDVATGRRTDTLTQPEKDQYAVAFSPSGRQLVAGGVDNRIRVWELRGMGRENTTPLLYSRFAHEQPILRLLFTPDGRRLISSSEDRTLKLWETEEFTQQATIGGQSDWVSALAVSPSGKRLLVGRMDGTRTTLPLAGASGVGARAAPITRVPLPEPVEGAAKPQAATDEVEPNDDVGGAMELALPGVVAGVLNPAAGKSQDIDLYRIEARAGQTWMLETNAARNKSPADTRIEVLHADGEPVLRYQLQAVRDSWIEFRPIDSSTVDVRVKYWEEMELNQFLYLNGEVCKLFRAPQGPDSGFNFYGSNGKRRCYFNTSATIHAVEDPVYIVEAYPAGASLVDNGLPVFPLYYANDDDGGRELGTDSRLAFTAPADGAYLVRVTETGGFGGPDFKYTLAARVPQPDFTATVQGKGGKVARGSGKRIVVKLDRSDLFDGDVRVDIRGLPDGFSVSSPIVVEAGHLEARGVVNCNVDAAAAAKEAWETVTVTATATIHGREVTKDLGPLGEIQPADKPKVLVQLLADPEAPRPADAASHEIVIVPGGRTSAILRIERHGADGPLRFDVDNLPHGVIVSNLGLNGITLLPGQTERRIFLEARPWVPETSRLAFAVSREEGNQCSAPVVVRVRGERGGGSKSVKVQE